MNVHLSAMIKILITDDHHLIRKNLRLLLQSKSDLQVVGEAENGRDAVRKVLEHCPDVVLMDISMPQMDGIEATRLIKKACHLTKIIAFSNHADEFFIQQMKSAGASYYLLKSSDGRDIEQTIRNCVS